MRIIKNGWLIEYTYQYCHVILNVIIELQPIRALPHADYKKELRSWCWGGGGNAFGV